MCTPSNNAVGEIFILKFRIMKPDFVTGCQFYVYNIHDVRANAYMHLYVTVISRARGMYGIYCTEARGRMPEG